MGYLQRLREICDANDILLIFDEVITGFGRCGAVTGADEFGVVPDILNVAKQITNGAVPMGAVIAKTEIYETFMAHGGPDYALEFAHGYTYSAHPVACAAGLAALDVLMSEALPQRVAAEAPYFETLLHEQLADKPHVEDVRNYGFAGALTLAAHPGGGLLATGHQGGSIRLWDADSGALLGELDAHDHLVWTLEFSPDGSRLASGGLDFPVRVWDTRSLEQVLELPGHTNSLRCVTWSPDGTKIASSGSDGTVRIWDAAPRHERRR